MTDRSSSWSPVGKWFHWTIAAVILVQIPLGFYARRVREQMLATMDLSQIDQVVGLFNWHKSIGITVFLLMLARLIWRLSTKAPPLVPMAPVLAFGARALQWMFYLAVFGLFVSGYILNEAAAHNIDFFWIVEIPLFFEIEEAAETLAKLAHKTVAFSLIGFVLLHTGAALYHHFHLRDETLIGMLPSWRGAKQE